jgi:hypothetical protein
MTTNDEKTSMSEHGDTKYEERYCAFIDFLGFAEAVNSGAWQPDDVLAAMKKANKVVGDSDIKFTQFSDSLVLSALAEEEWSFLSIVLTARFLIFELTAHAVLLRGGITKGAMFHEDNLAFGPAFIRAYRLEQAAATPRIILDKDLVEEALWPSTMVVSEKKDFKMTSIPKDYDGWRYVDYLSPSHASEFDALEEGLESHYEQLRAMVTSHSTSSVPSLISKYGWLDAKLKAVGK